MVISGKRLNPSDFHSLIIVIPCTLSAVETWRCIPFLFFLFPHDILQLICILSEVTIDLIFAEMHRDGGSGLAPWPARLTTPPPRLADLYVTADTFEKDTVS